MGFPALRSHPSQGGIFQIAGFTYDGNGALLPNCTVLIHKTSDNTFVGSTTSNAAGYFSFISSQGATTYYLTGYLAGSPDVEGTTVNTLTAA